jgi:recombination protein RecR
MFAQLPVFQQLIRQLQRIPYLASKNVYKVAIYFLTSDQKAIENLCATIIEAKKAIRPCVRCFNWTEGAELCTICASQKRDQSIICVVETWYDLFALENAGEYRGVYHVLGGALCPLEGVGPDQLTIPAFLSRLDDSVKEIIFATNPTPEGEATASYIWSKMNKKSINVSKLASGVPIGSSLEYMDRVTIGKALLGRRPF